MQNSAILSCPFAGMDDDVAYQNVSVLHCLGEIPLAKYSYTDSSYLGSDCDGKQWSYKFGREAVETGWILALPPLHDSHCNCTARGLLKLLDIMSQH